MKQLYELSEQDISSLQARMDRHVMDNFSDDAVKQQFWSSAFIQQWLCLDECV